MQFYQHKKKLSLCSIPRAILLSAIPTLIGVAILYMSVSSQLSQQLNNEVDKSFQNFERIFNLSNSVASSNIRFENRPCTEVISELRREATRQLYIRSINLIDNNKIYCSSVLENDDELVEISSHLARGNTIVPGNILTPNSPVLYIRNRNTLIGIDGRLLTPFLRTPTPGINLVFTLDGRELHSSGRIYTQSIPLRPGEKRSQKWDFGVYGELAPDTQWAVIWQNYLPVVILFCLTSFFMLIFFTRKFLSKNLTAKDISRAIKQGHIIPYAQPIFDATGENLWGMEILARWKDVNGKVITPDFFIPQAEQSNVIMALTSSLIEQTSKELAGVFNLLPTDFHVSFNISNRCCETDELTQLYHSAFMPLREKIALTLELTERESFQDSTHLRALMKSLKESGVKLAIDDFGTAGSNLDYIRDIEFDFIKIDKSYVAGIGSNTASQHIIDNILDLAQRLNMQVIAEGIENSQQIEYLRSRGVRYFQGYLYSPPLPLNTLLNKYLRPLF